MIAHGEESALAAIVRSSHDAVIAKTIDGTITAWNDGARLIYGSTAEQMIGRNVETMIPDDWLEEERARHARVAQGAAESGYRCSRLRADGQPVEVVMSMSPVRDPTGRIVGIASISRPLSERERADARFASWLEAAPDAIVCVTLDGRIAMVNARVTTLFGYERGELVGSALELLVPSEARERHRQHQREYARDLRRRDMGIGLSLSGRRKDGSTFPIEVSLAPDLTARDPMVIAAVRDVSERHAMEAAVRESEMQLRQVAENVNIVVILQQLNPRAYLYVSPGCEKILGVAAPDLTASSDLGIDKVHPADQDRVRREFLAAVDAGVHAKSEHRIVVGEQEIRWVRTSSRPVPNSRGAPERAVVTIEDITDRVQAAEALREAEATARAANEAKSLFLSRMSHEFRTPLNAVLGFGQLLERQLQGSPHITAVDYILKGGRHLLDLINDVMDIARIESGEMSLSLEPTCLADLVGEALDLMKPLAQDADIVLLRETTSRQEYALADRQRLRQILLNLVSNAVKYNHRGGRVWVAWSEDAAWTSVSVRDSGPGIDPALHGRVFNSFDRLGAEATTIEGTGVGLTVTRSLVELMGGSIMLDSAPGKGSTFTVRLPRARGGAAALPAVRSRQPVASTAPRTSALLLYIEDNEPNVRVVEAVLGLRPGWRLIHAALGTLGVELAQAHRPDLVLLDLHLPDRSGTEVLAALKSDPTTAALAVAVISADATEGRSQRLLDAGARKYLTKPIVLDELLALLDDVAAASASGAPGSPSGENPAE
jgi:PAS domain S-box-containing protein